MKEKSVKFYANTFAGNVYVTEKGEIVYGLIKNVQGSALGVRSLDKNKTMKTSDKRPETQEPVARPISSQLGLDVVPANFINRPETVGAELASAQSRNVAAEPRSASSLKSRNRSLDLLIEKNNTPKGVFLQEGKNENPSKFPFAKGGDNFYPALGKGDSLKSHTLGKGGFDSKRETRNSKLPSKNVGQGLSLAKESNPEGLPYKINAIETRDTRPETKDFVVGAETSAELSRTLASARSLNAPVGLNLRESLIGAKEMNIKGEDKAKTQVNYFVGDKKNWKSDIPAWNEVNFGEVYNGITFKIKAYGKNVEKIFTVNPGGKVEDIKLGLHGAEGMEVNKSGELEVETELGKIKFTKPYAYQEIDGKRVEVECKFEVQSAESTAQSANPKLSKNEIASPLDILLTRNVITPSSMPHAPSTELSYGFTVASYNPNYPLIIDPLLASTFLGGSGSDGYDSGSSIAIDSGGNIFMTGSTSLSKYPTTPGAYDTSFNSSSVSYDVFVSKLDNNLSTFLSSTFLGGSSNDIRGRIIIDSSGNIIVSGGTSSSDFPTIPGAYDTSFNGGDDVFVSKLNNNLSTLLSSTFLGGTSTLSS